MTGAKTDQQERERWTSDVDVATDVLGHLRSIEVERVKLNLNRITLGLKVTDDAPGQGKSFETIFAEMETALDAIMEEHKELADLMRKMRDNASANQLAQIEGQPAPNPGAGPAQLP